MDNPEHQRGAERNSRMTALLGGAGLTGYDLLLFDTLHQQDHSVFVHGSIHASRITEKSDVDFTIIGNREDMSSELRDTIMPGLEAVEAMRRSIDYISTSIIGQTGRKISMHISEPEFREGLPVHNKPYATEYRSGAHAKKDPRKYFLSAANRDGNIRLVNFLCESETVGTDGATVTDIPQTGLLTLKGNSLFVNGVEKTGMTADHVIRLTADGRPDEVNSSDAEELMVVGLEFDKMLSDTSIYNDPAATQHFVEDPVARSVKAIGEFTQTDPDVVTKQLFNELALHWPKVKPHKSR